MDDRLRRAEHPMVGVGALNPHPGLIRGDDLGPAQRRDGGLATGLEAGLRTPEQVHQAALAEREPEQIR
jgi:hypothetical protein